MQYRRERSLRSYTVPFSFLEIALRSKSLISEFFTLICIIFKSIYTFFFCIRLNDSDLVKLLLDLLLHITYRKLETYPEMKLLNLINADLSKVVSNLFFRLNIFKLFVHFYLNYINSFFIISIFYKL